ncbi:unnamed protein product, partial [Notodromas monacha]
MEVEEQNGGMILSPDHPFLAKYQATLSEFLRANLAKVDLDIKNLQVATKAKETEYFNDLGVKLYDAKKTFDQRRDRLNDVSVKLATAIETRKLKQDAVSQFRSEVARASQIVSENRKLSNELDDEAARLAGDARVLAALRKDVDLQMDILKNAVQKTEKDLDSNEEMKQRQDLFVDRLEQEVLKRERRKEYLFQKLNESKDDMSSLETELKRLNAVVEENKKGVDAAETGWRNAVSKAATRQDNYARLNENLNKLRSEATVTQNAILATRRLAMKEMEEHERLTDVKRDLDTQNARVSAVMSQHLREIDELNSESGEKLNFAGEITSCLESETARNSALVVQRDAVFAELQKVKAKREEVEAEIVANLRVSEAGKNAVKHFNRLKAELRDVSRNLEAQVADLENTIAAGDLAIASANVEISNLKSSLNLQTEDVRKRSDCLKRVVRELKSQDDLLVKKHSKVDQLSKKLAALTGAVEMTKELEEGELLQRSINALKEEVNEARNTEKLIQRTWLKLQHESLELNRRRTSTEKEISDLEDKSALMSEKYSHLAIELETERRDVLFIRKTIRDLRNAVTQLTNELSKVEESRLSFERETELKELELSGKMKEIDAEIVTKRSEIQDGLQALGELTAQIVEAEAITSAWDRKYHMCKDFKDVAAEEDSENGEMALRRAELNRLIHEAEMIRQRREQLTQKLENCVHRRQHLCDEASARSVHPPKSLSAIARRRIKELDTAAAETQKKAKAVGVQIRKLILKRDSLEAEATVVKKEADSSKSAVLALKT